METAKLKTTYQQDMEGEQMEYVEHLKSLQEQARVKNSYNVCFTTYFAKETARAASTPHHGPLPKICLRNKRATGTHGDMRRLNEALLYRTTAIVPQPYPETYVHRSTGCPVLQISPSWNKLVPWCGDWKKILKIVRSRRFSSTPENSEQRDKGPVGGRATSK